MDGIRAKVIGEPLTAPPNLNFLDIQTHKHAAISEASVAGMRVLPTKAPDEKTTNTNQKPAVETAQHLISIRPIQPFAGVAHPAGESNRIDHPSPPAEQPKLVPPVEQPIPAPHVEQPKFVLHGEQAKMVLHDGSIAQFSQDFDPSKKINLLIYNHGFDDSAKSSYQTENLEQIMQGAKPNTLIVAPEWQKSPGSESYAESAFDLASSLREISNKTPGLGGKKIDLNMVGEIDIIAHSAGHAPTETMLADKDIRGKIKNIAYLDALYRTVGIEDWVMNNSKSISRGEKGFYDFYTLANPAKPNATARNTKHFIDDLDHAGLPTHSSTLQFNLTTYRHSDLPKLLIPKLLTTF